MKCHFFLVPLTRHNSWAPAFFEECSLRSHPSLSSEAAPRRCGTDTPVCAFDTATHDDFVVAASAATNVGALHNPAPSAGLDCHARLRARTRAGFAFARDRTRPRAGFAFARDRTRPRAGFAFARDRTVRVQASPPRATARDRVQASPPRATARDRVQASPPRATARDRVQASPPRATARVRVQASPRVFAGGASLTSTDKSVCAVCATLSGRLIAAAAALEPLNAAACDAINRQLTRYVIGAARLTQFRDHAIRVVHRLGEFVHRHHHPQHGCVFAVMGEDEQGYAVAAEGTGVDQGGLAVAVRTGLH